MALTTQYVKLWFKNIVIEVGDNNIRCIKDFPDIDPRGETDQIETTTLCDEYHQFIDGLKNYADTLEFTANYDEAIFDRFNIQEYSSSSTYSVGKLARYEGIVYRCITAINSAEAFNSTKWEKVSVELRLCQSASDNDGKNGKFVINECDISVRLSGAGVGDVLEMVYVIKPKSAITFSTVA